MSAEYFLDTNVVVYSFDKSAPAKREKSVNLIAEGKQIFLPHIAFDPGEERREPFLLTVSAHVKSEARV